MSDHDSCCSDHSTSDCCHGDSAPSCCVRGGGCCDSSSHSDAGLGGVYAMLLLRGWLAVRAIQSGIEKYAGTKAADQLVPVDGNVNEYGLTAPGTVKFYAWENYHGVPQSLMSQFKAEPLMLQAALPWYDKLLGPALIVLGATILLGFATRTSLFLLGLIYISLTWGLILLKKDEGVAWLGVHLGLIVLALVFAKHDRLALLRKW